ncbi:MAG: RNA polymerase sigma factor RpoD/SigA [bacterium]|nr:RNA polymerase sigma factor RpoD/SigA [bacterium]
MKAYREPIRHSGEKSLDIYLKQIHDIPLLTREQECELARRIHEGDTEAQELLVKSNLRFVVSVAKQYAGQGLSLTDLINEGNVGLMKAADRFDEKRGFKFISYAVWWVRQAMLQALAEQSRIFRIPLNRATTLYRVGKVQQKLTQDLGREPSVDEIAERLKISRREVRGTLNIANVPLSMDESFGEDEENPLKDYLKDENSPGTDCGTYSRTLTEDVAKVLGTLDEREKQILTYYFGIGREMPETLESIGQRFSLTRERIRQIKEETLHKLRQCRQGKALKSYLES